MSGGNTLMSSDTGWCQEQHVDVR